MTTKQKLTAGIATVALAAAAYIATWEGGGTPTKDGKQAVYMDKLAAKPLPTACGGLTAAMDNRIKIGASFTQQQCDDMLAKVTEKELKQVVSVVTVQITPDQAIALTDFVHNLGLGKLKQSSLLKLINSGQCVKAGDEFLKWNKATVNGKLVPVKGLTKRRQSNREMWLRGCQ